MQQQAHQQAGTTGAARLAPPCMPADSPCGPGATHLALVAGRWQPVHNPRINAGPSAAPALPDSRDYVWLQDGSRMTWCLLRRNTPNDAPPAPTAPGRANPTPRQAGVRKASSHRPARTTTKKSGCKGPLMGFYAIIFGPSKSTVLTNAGTPFRAYLSDVSRNEGVTAGEGLGAAIMGLGLGRLQWLGDTASEARHAVRVKLGCIPRAYQQALKANRQPVAAAIRKTLGWRLVLNQDGHALSQPAHRQADANRFSPLALQGTDDNPDAPVPQRAGTQNNHDAPRGPAAPTQTPVTLEGMPVGTAIVRRRAGRAVQWGVACLRPQQPDSYTVTFLKNATKTQMTAQEVVEHMAYSWEWEVPKAHRAALKKLARTINTGTALQRTPPAFTVPDGMVIKKRFQNRGTFHGVVSLLPCEAPPYVHEAAYTDGDKETMTPAEAMKYRVPAASVPEAAKANLAELGANLPATPAAAPAPTNAATAPAPTAPEQQRQQQPPRPAGGQAPVEQRRCRAEARRSRRRAAGLTRQANLVWAQGGINIACINVHGLTATKACELQTAMQHNNVDVIGVTETWEGKCKPTSIAGYTFISKPREGGKGGGVGFYVARPFAAVATAFADTRLPESLWLRLDSKRSGAPPLFVGLAYIPPSSLATAAAADEAYTALQEDIRRFQQKGEVVVMGDLNSRVGRADVSGMHIGQFGEPETNQAGTRLITLLRDTSLFALNGRREHVVNGSHVPEYTRVQQLTTAEGEEHTQQSVLDYVLAPASWALPTPPQLTPRSELTVLSVHTVSGTDHAMLWFRAPHPAAKQTPDTHTQPRPKTYLLAQPNTNSQPNPHQEEYAKACKQACEGYEDFVTDLQRQQQEGSLTPLAASTAAKDRLTTLIFTAVERSIGFSWPRRRPHSQKPPVWTTEVKRAVRAKHAAAALVAKEEQKETGNLAAAQAALSRAQKAVKSKVAAARASYHDAKVQAVYDCRDNHDGKGMWAGLRALAGASKGSTGPTALKSREGPGLLTGDKAIADRLAAQYQAMSSDNINSQGAEFDADHKRQIEAQVCDLRSNTSFSDSGPEELSAPIGVPEVTDQCLRLHNNKAPSPLDSVSNELLKYGGEALHAALAALFDMQFQGEAKAKTRGVITPVFKKGDPTEPANYRPITLGSAIDKLYNLVLNKRIMGHLEQHNKLHDAQQGFRPGRSAVDNIFMLRTCLDARLQRRMETYVLFLDIEKAYDKVWRAGLLWHLWHKGIRGKLFRVLANMVDHTPCVVLHNGAFSDTIQPDLGWEQGDTLATTMFNVFIDSVLQRVWADHAGVPVPQGAGTPAKLVALMYADDLAGLAESTPQLQSLINHTRAALAKWRLKASVNPSDTSKTAVMLVRKHTAARRRQAAAPAAEFKWGDTTVPTVSAYKYLGVHITSDGKWDTHLEQRMRTATASGNMQRKVLRDAHLPVSLRLLTLTGVVQPALTYAAQVWARSTVQQHKMLDSWQMALAAQAFHCPPTASHICLQQELGLTPLHVTCETLALRYWHHLQNVPKDRLLSQVANAWTGKENPWLTNMDKLLKAYKIDKEAAAKLGRQQFHSHCATKAMEYLKSYWAAPPRHQAGAVQSRYQASTGTGRTTAKHSKPRPYMINLTDSYAFNKGRAAELCMQLRTECLPLFAMHNFSMGRESTAGRERRQQCPCCREAAETPAHFLLECPAYSTLRSGLCRKLQSEGLTMPTEWRVLVGADYLENSDTQKHVADFIQATWNFRRAVLAGREAYGGHPMALALVPGSDSI
jgi:exonuclease III